MSNVGKGIANYVKFAIDFSDGMRILNCDASFEELFGVGVDEVKSRRVTLNEFVTPDEIGRLQPTVMEQFEDESCAFLHANFHDRSGNEFSAEVYMELVINPDNDHAEGKVLVIQYHEDGSLVYADTIIKQIPAGIAVFGVSTSITVKNANEEFYRILGYSDEQEFMISNGENIRNLISDKDYERLMVLFSMANSEEEIFEYKVRVNKKSGANIWLLLKLRFLEKTNETMFFQAHVSDITLHQEMELELNSLNDRPNPGVLKEVIFRYNALEDKISIPMKNFFGEVQETVIDHFLAEKKWSVFVVEKDIKRVEGELSRVLKFPSKGEILFRNKMHVSGSDEWYKIFFKNNATKEHDADWVMGRIVNITDEKDSDSKVQTRMRHDSITGFYNYQNFERRIKEIIMESYIKYSSIIVLSISNLSEINDRFGSMFADTVIQNVSRKIFTLVRDTDVLGRLSQDTFAIWLRNVEPEIVYAKAKEICNSVSSVYSGEQKRLNIQSCAGISNGTEEDSFEDTFARAYSAMDYAKNQENKCVVEFRESMPLVRTESDKFEKELYYRIENYDVDMLSFAFGLLLNSKDIKSSINMLLQRMGERYNLDDIVITSLDGKEHIIKNHWSKAQGFKNKKKVKSSVTEMLLEHNGRFDEKGMFVFNEIQSDEWVKAFKKSGYKIKSMVGCAYYIDKELAGFIGFIDSTGPRDWSEYVRGTFYEMVNILTVFISMYEKDARDKKRLSEMAEKDHLTGLLNVDAFKRKANNLIDKVKEDELLVIVFSDFNNFAYINDTYGQQSGDKLLKHFGEYIGKRKNISCRVYSDYFMTFGVAKGDNLRIEDIGGINKKFEMLARELFPLSNVKISSGLFVFKPGDCDIETAIDNANMARKECKRNGESACLLYDKTMRKNRENEQKLVGGLQEAITNGEFRLYLQPKFRLDTKEVIGAEALSRWITDDGIVHMPDEFIPTFEKQGQIVQVDFYIYEQVLMAMARWKKSGKKLIPVSVNFSRIHVNHDNFVDELSKLASFHGIPTNLLEIEITESAISSNDDAMISKLTELRSRGFVVNMDDFGTGLSSLNMLLNAPVDVVKVDKSFLNASISQKNRKYIEYLGGLITAADKEIIFEGVENEEQAKFLMDCGYTKAQGFLFDTPMEASEFEKKYIYNC